MSEEGDFQGGQDSNDFQDFLNQHKIDVQALKLDQKENYMDEDERRLLAIIKAVRFKC